MLVQWLQNVEVLELLIQCSQPTYSPTGYPVEDLREARSTSDI